MAKELKVREWFPAEGTMEPVVADWVISTKTLNCWSNRR